MAKFKNNKIMRAIQIYFLIDHGEKLFIIVSVE